MNRRIKKKQWKAQTTAQQADLLDRVSALEELAGRMSVELTHQKVMVSAVSDDLSIYKAAQRRRQEREIQSRMYRDRVRREREEARKRLVLSSVSAFAALIGALLFLSFALAL